MNIAKLARLCVLPLWTAAAASANASTVVTTALGAGENSFNSNISSTDLVQAGAASLGSVTASRTPTFPVSGVNDGSGAHSGGVSYWGGAAPAAVDLTFNLTGSATGYDISSVNSIFGWSDVRYRHAAQNWELYVQTVSNATFTQIGSVHLNPWGAYDGAAGSTQVTMTGSTGLLASGVTAIRFHLLPYGALGDTGYTAEVGVIRELDVFGQATGAVNPASVPEPGTVALLGLCATALVASRRRKSL